MASISRCAKTDLVLRDNMVSAVLGRAYNIYCGKVACNPLKALYVP